MELWICRHGESLADEKNILQGQTECDVSNELTELGYMQTLLLAKRLSKVKFKEIYASDAKRCLKTANEIFQTLENKNDIKIIDSPLLKEKNYGNLDGKNLEEVKIIVPEEKLKILRPDGGENRVDVFLRAKYFLYYLIEKYFHKNFIEKVNTYIDNKINFLVKKFEENNEDKKSDFEQYNKEFKLYQSKLDFEKFLLKSQKITNLEDKRSTPIMSNKEMKSEFTDIESKELEQLGTFTNLNFKIYNESEIKLFLNSVDMSFLNELQRKQYIGYNENENNKILIVTHSGFICEIINLIRKLWNLKPTEMSKISHCGLYVIRIYCLNCGPFSICKDEESCRVTKKILEFDFLLSNDVSHLNILNTGEDEEDNF